MESLSSPPHGYVAGNTTCLFLGAPDSAPFNNSSTPELIVFGGLPWETTESRENSAIVPRTGSEGTLRGSSRELPLIQCGSRSGASPLMRQLLEKVRTQEQIISTLGAELKTAKAALRAALNPEETPVEPSPHDRAGDLGFSSHDRAGDLGFSSHDRAGDLGFSSHDTGALGFSSHDTGALGFSSHDRAGDLGFSSDEEVFLLDTADFLPETRPPSSPAMLIPQKASSPKALDFKALDLRALDTSLPPSSPRDCGGKGATSADNTDNLLLNFGFGPMTFKAKPFLSPPGSGAGGKAP